MRELKRVNINILVLACVSVLVFGATSSNAQVSRTEIRQQAQMTGMMSRDSQMDSVLPYSENHADWRAHYTCLPATPRTDYRVSAYDLFLKGDVVSGYGHDGEAYYSTTLKKCEGRTCESDRDGGSIGGPSSNLLKRGLFFLNKDAVLLVRRHSVTQEIQSDICRFSNRLRDSSIRSRSSSVYSTEVEMTRYARTKINQWKPNSEMSELLPVDENMWRWQGLYQCKHTIVLPYRDYQMYINSDGRFATYAPRIPEYREGRLQDCSERTCESSVNPIADWSDYNIDPSDAFQRAMYFVDEQTVLMSKEGDLGGWIVCSKLEQN